MCHYIIEEYAGCGHSVTNLTCVYKDVPEMDLLARDRCPGKRQADVKRREPKCPDCSILPRTYFHETMKNLMNIAPTPEDDNRREAVESASVMMANYQEKISEVPGPQVSNHSLDPVGSPLSMSNEQQPKLYHSHQLQCRTSNSATINIPQPGDTSQQQPQYYQLHQFPDDEGDAAVNNEPRPGPSFPFPPQSQLPPLIDFPQMPSPYQQQQEEEQHQQIAGQGSQGPPTSQPQPFTSQYHVLTHGFSQDLIEQDGEDMAQSQSQAPRPLPQQDLLPEQSLKPVQAQDLTLDPDALEDLDLLIPDVILLSPSFQQGPEPITVQPQIALPSSDSQHVWLPQRAMTQQQLFSQNHLHPNIMLQPAVFWRQPDQTSIQPQSLQSTGSPQQAWVPQRAMTQQQLFFQNMHTFQQSPQPRAMPQGSDDDEYIPEFIPEFIDTEQSSPSTGR